MGSMASMSASSNESLLFSIGFLPLSWREKGGGDGVGDLIQSWRCITFQVSVFDCSLDKVVDEGKQSPFPHESVRLIKIPYLENKSRTLD